MKTKKAVGKLKRKKENRKTVVMVDCLIDGLVREKMLTKGERKKRKRKSIRRKVISQKKRSILNKNVEILKKNGLVKLKLKSMMLKRKQKEDKGKYRWKQWNKPEGMKIRRKSE